MRIYNPLRLKKFIRDRFGLTPMSRRLDDLYAEKADFADLGRMQWQLAQLTEALSEIIQSQSLSQDVESLRSKLDEVQRSIVPSEDTITPDSPMVFVCGLHRSGTSLLTKVLQRCDDIGGFEGTHAIEDEGQHLQSVYPTDRDLGHPGSFGFDPEAHLTESSNLRNEPRRRKLARQWSRYLPPGKSFYLEKSPPNLLKSRYLQAMFPNAKFIVVKRHPIAVSLATKKWNTSWLPSLIHHWVHCYEVWQRDREHIRDYLEVSYEDFVTQPRETLSTVGAFLGLDGLERRCLPEDDHGIKPGVNNRYFELWSEKGLERHLCQLLYEGRVKSFGYSLYVDQR